MANKRNERRKKERVRRLAELKEADPVLYRAVAAGFIEGRLRDMAGAILDPHRLACDLATCGGDDQIDRAIGAAYAGLVDVHLIRPRPTSQRGHTLR